MRKILPENLLRLANVCPRPLYVVGGSVRDFLACLSLNRATKAWDWDISSPMPAEAFEHLAKSQGFVVKSTFRNTGTVKLQDKDGIEYEYTCFRSDKYVRGIHVPVESYFTDDIRLDALRRDFTANAVYYDLQKGVFVDPLNDGLAAISEKRLSTVAPAEKVFGEDGLRLLRLARQAAQSGFAPDRECLQGATQNAALIQDISSERIFTEFTALLNADQKHGVQDGHYRGLRILEQTGVLRYILPELTLGKGMSQRADFHNYDVLEHSFRAVLYVDPRVRFAALLHDVGKPACAISDGNTYEHATQGAAIAKTILQRLKAPKRFTERVCQLVQYHMYDFNCQTGENKLRRFFVTHSELLEDLLLLKQADFSACKDDLAVAPTCARWRALLSKMRLENTPFSLKELALTGKDVLELGAPPATVAGVLNALLLHTATEPKDNVKERLLRLAKGYLKQIR
ncbi:MAG: CCA tRNA nucleotidyltransferase [Clostridia bacterium]|nr:CCA tRNA nucleotidyltransferase [Clostridia bacterium]